MRRVYCLGIALGITACQPPETGPAVFVKELRDGRNTGILLSPECEVPPAFLVCAVSLLGRGDCGGEAFLLDPGCVAVELPGCTHARWEGSIDGAQERVTVECLDAALPPLVEESFPRNACEFVVLDAESGACWDCDGRFVCSPPDTYCTADEDCSAGASCLPYDAAVSCDDSFTTCAPFSTPGLCIF